MTEETTNVLVVRVPRAIDDIDICLEHIKTVVEGDMTGAVSGMLGSHLYG